MDRSKEAPFILSPSPSPSPPCLPAGRRWGEGKGEENERRKKWIRKKNRF
jgi:hypothetical protein